MKSALRLFAGLALVSLFVVPSWAEPCPGGLSGTTVFYINGIDTERRVALVERALLEKRLRDYLAKTGEQVDCLKVRLGLNHSDKFIFDFLESADEFAAAPESMDILRHRKPATAWFLELILIKWSKIVDPRNASYGRSQDVRDIVAEVRGALDDGDRVIVVGHSQGNLFANEISRVLYIGNDDGKGILPTRRMGVVAVATPAAVVGEATETEPHITLTKDAILKVPGALAGNVDQECGNGWDCHSFIGSYMRIAAARDKILKAIVDVRTNLSTRSPPTAQFSIPSSLFAGSSITFDATGSSIGAAMYTWDFGDGTKITTDSPRITHTYESAGGVTVTLTVSNTAGTSTAKKDIIIKLPAAQLTVGPISLNVGDVAVGSCATGDFVIQHVVDTAPTSGTVSASPTPSFRVTAGAVFALSGSAAASVTIQFCPTSTGPRSGTATVTSDASFTNTNTVSLSGNGVALNPLRLISTYVGGSGSDSICCVVIHPATGDVYVAGTTSSPNFPGVSGGAQDTFPFLANSMAFIVRLNANLTTVLGATYLGGSGVFTGAGAFGGENAATALAVHPATGDIYVTGTTASPFFPGTAGGAQPTIAGNGDGFVARLTADLRTLVQSTYVAGGSLYDQPTSIAVHPSSGEIYVGGVTQLSTNNLAGTAGGAQPAAGGGLSDGFIVRLDETLTALRQATFLGGQSDEFILGLAIHPRTGDVYVTGWTYSPDFPGAAGGAQPYGGSGDGFVARFNAGLSVLFQSTYLGGSNGENNTAIALHPTSGEVYVVGTTNSLDFPGIPAGALANRASESAYVARLSADLTTLLRTAFLSGNEGAFPNAVAIHPASGDVYVLGDTDSPDLPGTAGSIQPGLSSPPDAFVARFSRDLSSLIGATYLGGGRGDPGAGLAINPATGALYVVGTTDSTDFPNTAGGAQPAYAGGNDGFVATIPDTLAR